MYSTFSASNRVIGNIYLGNFALAFKKILLHNFLTYWVVDFCFPVKAL